MSAIRRFIRDLPYNLRKIKWFFQRGKRGWADCDIWSMDMYLARIIPEMLRNLRRNTHGYPGWEEAYTPENWDKIIEQIAEGFEAAKRVCDDEYYELTGFPEKRFEGDIKVWNEASMKDQKLFHERMKLFDKWFFNLWD